VSILVDLLLLSHLQRLVPESLATSAAAKCVEAAQALDCFGHLRPTVPVSGLGYHFAYDIDNLAAATRQHKAILNG